MNQKSLVTLPEDWCLFGQCKRRFCSIIHMQAGWSQAIQLRNTVNMLQWIRDFLCFCAY